MPEGLFTVLSLGMRYWFALLGVLIVLQSFLWLWRDRREKHARLKTLPDSGMIGEMVVLDGTDQVPEGTVFPIPWEGNLGSGSQCDIILESGREGKTEIGKVHLWFSFDRDRGLTVSPARGREVYVDGDEITWHLWDRSRTMPGMHHGSIMEVGPYVLRLRLFAGLDLQRPYGQTRKADLHNFGTEIGSRAMPQRGLSGWQDPQTEEERLDNLGGRADIHLVEEEETSRGRKHKGKGRKK